MNGILQKYMTEGQLRSPMTWLVVAVFLLTMIPFVLPVYGEEGLAWYADAWVDIPIIGLVALAALFRRPAESAVERGFWLAMGIGFGIWMIGRVFWAVIPYESLAADLVADFLFLQLYIGLIVALELGPGRRDATPLERRLRLYSIAGGATLFLGIYIYFALIPGLIAPDTYHSWKPAVIGAVFCDTYVALRLAILWRRSLDPRWRKIYAWLLAGFGLWIVTDAVDVAWSYWNLERFAAGKYFEMIWFIPYGFFLMGVLLGRRTGPATTVEPRAEEEPGLQPPLGSTPVLTYVAVLPYIHGLLYVLGALDPALRTARMILLMSESAVLLVLVGLTHRFVFRENEQLRQDNLRVSRSLSENNLELEERVERRTAALEQANRDLAADVEQRARIVRRLGAATARYEALVNAMPDSLVLLDHEGIVLDALPAKDQPGLPALADSRGSRFADLLPEEVRAPLIEALARSSGCGDEPALPLDVVIDGENRHLELRCGHGIEGEKLVVIQDATRRREVEAAMQQSQKLESLGVMAGGVAHDFNNLLVTILGNAQMVRADLSGQPEFDAPLAAIENNAVRAGKLTDNLLAYTGQARIERQLLDVGGLLTELTPLLQAAVPKKSTFKIAAATGSLWMNGNEAQITQIILNLVRNAAEALDDRSGIVQVKMDRIHLPSDTLSDRVLDAPPVDGPCIRLRVTDTGCGMSPETRLRIFDPFFTTKATGRGLGLAAVLGIVTHHEGTLTMDTAPGAGTTFTVYFPEQEAPAREETPRPRPALTADGTGMVLVVDDESDVRDMLGRFLEQRGIGILQAGTGREAVELVRAHRGQIKGVLLDYAMPEMDGAEALVHIRRDNPDLPVVMMSGYGERDALAGLENQRWTGFVHKPFTLPELEYALAKWEAPEARQMEE